MKNRISFALLAFLPFLFFLGDMKIFWLCHFFLLLVIILEKRKISNIKSNIPLFLIFPLLWTFLFSLEDNAFFIIKALFYLTTPVLLTFLGMKLSSMASQKLVVN